MEKLIARVDALTAALETARADEAEARACGMIITPAGVVFAREAAALRIGIEARLTELENEIFDLQGFEIAPGESVPLSGLIDLEDRF